MIKVYTYTPDVKWDFGHIVGDHEVQLVAWIRTSVVAGPLVTITEAKAKVRSTHKIQDVDILPFIQALPATRRDLELEILVDYRKTQEALEQMGQDHGVPA